MDFISVKKAAERWGISPARASYLAKQGRIPGAQLVGKSWLIPENAEKPADGRTRAAKQSVPAREFHFPVYYLSRYTPQQIAREFAPDEQRLYAAETAYLQGDWQGAYDALQALLPDTQDAAVRAGCCYYLCKSCKNLGRYAEFEAFYGRFLELLQEDIPHKKELELILYDLETYFLGNRFLAEEFRIGSDDNYHPGAWCFLMSITAYAAVMRAITNRVPADVSAYEILCTGVDADAPPALRINFHMYLAVMQALNGGKAAARSHLEKALRIGLKNNLLRQICYYYRYWKKEFDAVLRQPGLEDAAVIEAYCGEYFAQLEGLLSYLGGSGGLLQLERRDYTLVYLASQGLSNAEIARRLHLSLSTVSKRFSEICRRTGTAGKKELAEYLLKSIYNY